MHIRSSIYLYYLSGMSLYTKPVNDLFNVKSYVLSHVHLIYLETMQVGIFAYLFMLLPKPSQLSNIP